MRRRNARGLAALALGIAMAVGAREAAAGDLAPGKTSEVVMLRGFDPCPTGAAGSLLLDNLIGPDGNGQPGFSVPAKRMLVLTSFAWDTANAPPGSLVSVALQNVGAGVNVTLYSAATADASGHAFRRETLSPGALFEEGHLPCLLPVESFSLSWADGQGFIAKDK